MGSLFSYFNQKQNYPLTQQDYRPSNMEKYRQQQNMQQDVRRNDNINTIRNQFGVDTTNHYARIDHGERVGRLLPVNHARTADIRGEPFLMKPITHYRKGMSARAFHSHHDEHAYKRN